MREGLNQEFSKSLEFSAVLKFPFSEVWRTRKENTHSCTLTADDPFRLTYNLTEPGNAFVC